MLRANSVGACALWTTSRAQTGSAIAFARNWRKGEGYPRDRISQAEPGRRQQLVKALSEPLAHGGRQLLHALEMIVERPLGDAGGLHDGIHRERLGWPLGEERRPGFDDLCPCSGTLLPSDFRSAR